jgi:glucose-6-phosphate 1-dehydrogenase
MGTTLLILGASGDLASRLLLPAVAQLMQRDEDLDLDLRGAGDDPWDDRHWRSVVRTAFDAAGCSDAFSRISSTHYTAADITRADDLAGLVRGTAETLVLYFAVPPSVAAAACEALREVNLPGQTVLALEKPFGGDEEGARRLNATLASLVPESQVFRVDHFLGRSTLLNVLGVRFANRVVEPLWSAEHVESVLLRYDESLALEDRARYYDRAGAMVDMLQSHLLQVLAVLAMEPPATLGERDLRDAKAAALRATRLWTGDAVTSSRRARYTAGLIGDRELPGYVDEKGVDPSRGTETLAEIVCEVRTARWSGVPFTLRSGKALGAKRAEIVVRFAPVRHLPAGFTGEVPDGGALRFSLGPDAMWLDLNVNGGEDPFALRRETLGLDLGEGSVRAYTEVLGQILERDVTLSVRADAAEECWRIVEPVRQAWQRGEVPLEEYPAGSAGPEDWETSGS